MRDVHISPDGKSVSYLQRLDGSYRLVIASFEDGTLNNPRRIDADKDVFINWAAWVNPTRLILSVTENARLSGTRIRLPARRLVGIDSDGGNALTLLKPTFSLRKIRLANDDVISLLEDEPDHILVGDSGRKTGTTVYRLNVHTGEKTVVLQPERDEHIWDWYADFDDVVRIGYGEDRKGRPMMLFRAEERAPWMPLHDHELFEDGRFRPLAFSEDSNIIYVLSSHITGRNAVFRFDVGRGALDGKVFEHKEVDVDRVFVSPARQRVVAFGYIADRPEMHFIDAEYERLHKILDAALPDRTNRIVSVSPDESFMIVWSGSDREPGTYFVFDPAAKRLTGFAYHYPDLPYEAMAPMRRVTVTARDSLEFPAFLTLPGAPEDGPFPTVVLPHGGPHSRDWIAFDYLVQFLANRGYAVLQPNFRGSEGYGSHFESLGYGGWGRAMQDDVTDATRWMIEEGLADPSRICIAGLSYGGYAAIMGVIREPELYRCAAAFAPVTDIKMLLKDIGEYGESYWSYQKVAGALTTKEIARISPLQRHKDITRPLLIVHGRQDGVVPVQHAQKLVKRLRGKPVTYVELEDGDHGLSEEKDRIRWLSELERFLAAHLDSTAQSARSAALPAD